MFTLHTTLDRHTGYTDRNRCGSQRSSGFTESFDVFSFPDIPPKVYTMRKLAVLAMSTLLVSTAAAAPNVLLEPWTGPFGGVPPFDRASPALLAPALEAGMAEHLAELERIANDPQTPTFANTIAAMERSGRALDRAATVYYIFSATLSDDAVQQVERDIEPKLAAFRDTITQNEKLFRRIAAVYETRTTSRLTAEEQRLTWLTYTNFVRAGAKLDAVSKKRLAEINQSLAGLFTRFSQNLLADESERFTVLESEADLAGLPTSLRAGFAADAERRGRSGKWVVSNTRSSVEPFLTYSTRRDLREKVWRVFVNRETTATHATTTPSSARFCSCAPSVLACSATKPTPTGGSRIPWRAHRSARCS